MLNIFAGPAVHNHLSNIMPPLLELASRPPEDGNVRAAAAREALAKVVGTVTEVGGRTLYPCSVSAAQGFAVTST